MDAFLQSTQEPSLLYLSKTDIAQLGGMNSSLYIKAVEQALIQHSRGDYVQPLKPYLRWGPTTHIADRIIAMPAFLGGPNSIAGLKWIGSRHTNPTRYHRDRASALIILNDPETNYPLAVMEGSLISGMRTAAVSALAVRHLAKKAFQRVACLGCGPIASMQLQTLLEQFVTLQEIYLFDLNPSAAQHLADRLMAEHPSLCCHITPSAEQAVRFGDVVLTCTTVAQPYLPFKWLAPGTLVCNVSIMDVEKDVFLHADKIVVDDWDQCNREKKVIHQLVMEGKLSRERIHAELGEILIGDKTGREADREIILFNPMGLAIEDIACAQVLYDRARAQNKGITLSLYGPGPSVLRQEQAQEIEK